jgi:hypothetical protein
MRLRGLLRLHVRSGDNVASFQLSDTTIIRDVCFAPGAIAVVQFDPITVLVLVRGLLRRTTRGRRGTTCRSPIRAFMDDVRWQLQGR